MPRYKRTREEAGFEVPAEPKVNPERAEMLSNLRNMWEFASVMQFIFMFGQVVKIDESFDIEDLEAECLRHTTSERLPQIGLALLKYVSSHRGLTPAIFDEYTRRQYLAKAPKRNPFGVDEEPLKFTELDVYTKIRVLHQLSTWTFGNVDRIRGLMPADEDHLSWRIEPLGWDKEDRSYFVLDDNRLYRRADEEPPPPTPPKPKAKSKAPKRKAKSRGTRSSKRRKTEEEPEDEEMEDVDAEEPAAGDTTMANDMDGQAEEEESGFGFTNKTWECIAITLEDYQEFLASIFRSRDANEKQLRKRVEEDVVPIIEQRAEVLRQKHLKQVRELENIEKMATAKRSGRLANKAEKEKQEREEQEAEERKKEELMMAHKEQERQKKIEEGHESRRLTREQRLKEREVKRILHEEELAKIEEQGQRASEPAEDETTDAANKRISERQLKTQREQHKRELEMLASEEEKWDFDCAVCGMHGENLDDGTHSIACEKCNVWQHSKCHGFSPKQAESEGFHFVCGTCKRKEEDAKKPKIPPLKLGKSKASASPESQRGASRPATGDGQTATNGQGVSRLPDHVARQLDRMPAAHQQASTQSPGPFGQLTNNAPSLSPYGQTQGPPGYRHPPIANFAPPPPQQTWQGNAFPPPARPPSSGYAGSPARPSSATNGYGPQRQHQQQHQNAVASSPGHARYSPSLHPQSNGYSPSSGAARPASQQSPQRQQHYYQPPHHLAPRPASNGPPSPAKQTGYVASTPPQQAQSPYMPLQQTHPNLAHSPSASFPPPQQHRQPPAHSPIKSSPPPQPHHHQPSHSHSHLMQTPQQGLRPPSSHAAHPAQQTPQGQTAPSPASANANGIAADGMSGPWPAGSKAIPQKTDPPASSPAMGGVERRVIPPAGAELAPSPSQQGSKEGAKNVPVKKMME